MTTTQVRLLFCDIDPNNAVMVDKFELSVTSKYDLYMTPSRVINASVIKDLYNDIVIYSGFKFKTINSIYDITEDTYYVCCLPLFEFTTKVKDKLLEIGVTVADYNFMTAGDYINTLMLSNYYSFNAEQNSAQDDDDDEDEDDDEDDYDDEVDENDDENDDDSDDDSDSNPPIIRN